MKNKIWKLKYKDVLVVTKEPNEMDNDRLIDSTTAKNCPDWNVVIERDKNGEDCHILSDKEIEGLELVGENMRLGE